MKSGDGRSSVDTVIWNVEKGLKLSGADIARAEVKRTELFQRVRTYLERYEFLILPVAQVAPFPIETDWVREINGTKMETYIDWMASCYAITLGLAGDFSAVRVHKGRLAGGPANCRAASTRFRCLAIGIRIRAGDEVWKDSPHYCNLNCG